jgi:hypothetical protein
MANEMANETLHLTSPIGAYFPGRVIIIVYWTSKGTYGVRLSKKERKKERKKETSA